MAKNGQNFQNKSFPRVPNSNFQFLTLSLNLIQKNYENLMRGFGEIAKIGRFWSKLAIFDQKLAKMAKF